MGGCVGEWVCVGGCACVCAKTHNYNIHNIKSVCNVLIPSDVAVPGSVVNTTTTSLSRVPSITSTLRVTISLSSLTL